MNGIIFIGPQASGKSTFYLQNFYNTHIRINMDMLKTRYREKIIFNACLEGKQPCVIDNTNPTKEERTSYIESFKKHQFDVIGYFFDASFDDCMTRNSLRIDNELVPDIGIKGTFKKLQKPTFDEGFSKLFLVKTLHNSFIVEEWSV